MSRPFSHLVIDARPIGPRGPLAGERHQGRSVLSRLLELARSLGEATVVVHARLEDHARLEELAAESEGGGIVFAAGPPPVEATALRSDRLYDPARLRRAWRKGKDPETAAIWRLDLPQGETAAEDELVRRQSYQPLGRYWALEPARLLARALRPTRVRPNALTLASGALMLGAAAAVAFGPAGIAARVATAAALALALVLDTADGHLARLQGTATEFGRWLDAALDELGDMALHAAVAWSAFAHDGRPGWLLWGMLYGMGKYQFMIGMQNKCSDPANSARPEASAAFSPLAHYVRLAGHADVRWHFWIVLAALGRLDAALATYAIYYPARAVAAAIRKGARRA